MIIFVQNCSLSLSFYLSLTLTHKCIIQAYGVIGPNVFLTDETRHKRATGIKERAIPRRGGGGVVGGVSGKTTAAASTGTKPSY